MKFEKNYEKQLKEIKNKSIQKEQVILVGDHFIPELDVTNRYKDLQIYNHSITSDTTTLLKETIYRRALKHKPKKLIISIGSNDIGLEHKSVKEIYHNIQDIIHYAKKRCKDSDIYIVSILPVNQAKTANINREYVDSRDNFDIDMLNYYIKNYTRKQQIHFINISKELQDDFKQLAIEYTFDGFHLNESGKEIALKCLEQYV